jgi:hypothetical protein
MKLFLSTNSETAKTENIKLLEVSVKSAIKNTNFEIFVIFDGEKKDLNLPDSINIIEHKHRCYDTFVSSGRDIKTASSAFLRTEIPFLCDKLGFNDEYCLYTDYDVIFQKGDYTPLFNIKPKYFAACPEINQNNWTYVNTGVMLMNLKQFKIEDEKIINFINNNFGKGIFSSGGWDQPILNYLYDKKFDKLPLEFNWKTYWGINKKSNIIHFHGPKPRLIEPEWRYNLNSIKKLRNKDIKAYEYYNNLFEEYLD